MSYLHRTQVAFDFNRRVCVFKEVAVTQIAGCNSTKINAVSQKGFHGGWRDKDA
jgi:hypothetical protein